MIRHAQKRPSLHLCTVQDEPDEKKARLDSQAAARFHAGLVGVASALDTGRSLYDHFKTLKEDMETLEVACLLKKKGVLDTTAYAKIIGATSRRRRVDAFIKALHEVMNHTVCTGTTGAYSLFLEALSETGQDKIRQMLQKPVSHPRPNNHEIETLFRTFMKKKKEILKEVEPLNVIDDILVLRGLHFQDHEEIIRAKTRKQRTYLLKSHLKSSHSKHSWRILKPISEKYKHIFSHSASREKLSPPNASSLTTPTPTESTSKATSSTTGEGASAMTLGVKFKNIRKGSIAVTDTNEHDHPAVKLSKLKELEKKVVDNVNNDHDKYKDVLEKLMNECTSSFKSLSFSSIKIHLHASTDTSLEQLQECCQDGRAKSWILSLIDEDTKTELRKLGATCAQLEIDIDEREDFLHIFDTIEEGCLCTLNSSIMGCNAEYVVRNIENIEESFITKALESNILPADPANKLSELKKVVDEKERREKLVDFLLKGNVSQTLFCLLEEEMELSGNAAAIIRLQQTKTCRISDGTTSYDTSKITALDLREHSEILEDEIEPRWFIEKLQLRSDEESKDILKEIEESGSRKERTKPFLEYLYNQDDLRWFEEVLKMHQTHLLHILKRAHVKYEAADLKVALLSTYDTVVGDIEPLQLVKHLPTSFCTEIDIGSLDDIHSRQRRASWFIRKALSGNDQRAVEVVETMKDAYSGIVEIIEKTLEIGSLCAEYKCPRIRRINGNLQTCVFNTEISLFGPDEDNSFIIDTEASMEDVTKRNIASGFVEAEITKYDRGIKHEKDTHWASYDRFNTNIGVIGSSGSCKRSLLNALCNRIVTDEETAPIYVETNLKKFGSYKEARNVTFWDLPEIDTEEFPRNTYLKDIDFKRYDCFIIMVYGKLEIGSNILIAKELAHLHRKVFLINTTKVDLTEIAQTQQPVAHCSSIPSATGKHMVETVRQNCHKELEGLGCSEATVFLINEDEILSSDYDFDKLVEKLTEEVADEKLIL